MRSTSKYQSYSTVQSVPGIVLLAHEERRRGGGGTTTIVPVMVPEVVIPNPQPLHPPPPIHPSFNKFQYPVTHTQSVSSVTYIHNPLTAKSRSPHLTFVPSFLKEQTSRVYPSIDIDGRRAYITQKANRYLKNMSSAYLPLPHSIK